MTKTPIKIELTEEDAVMFAQFQKRYAFFNLLESLKVFDIYKGSFTVHFDEVGGIKKVRIDTFYPIEDLDHVQRYIDSGLYKDGFISLQLNSRGELEKHIKIEQYYQIG